MANKKKKKLSGKGIVAQVTRDKLRIAKANLGASAPKLTELTAVELPQGAVDDGTILDVEAVTAALRTVLSSSAFRGVHQILWVLCTTQVASETTTVPRGALKRLDRLLLANADVYFPFSVEDYKLTWEVVGPVESDPEQITVQLWAIPRGMLQGYYVVGNGAGLAVAGVETAGHALAAAVGAGFALPAAAVREASKQTGKRSAKKTAAAAAKAPAGETPAERELEALTENRPAETERAVASTTLYLGLDPEQLLLTFVSGGVVRMQRVQHRGYDVNADLNDIQMAAEYYDTFFHRYYSRLDVVLCGDTANGSELSAALGDVMRVSVKPFAGSSGGPEWLLCEGAARALLDFGDPALNKVRRGEWIGQARQYAIVAVTGAACAAAILLYLGSSTVWENALQAQEIPLTAIRVRATQAAQDAANYQSYLSSYLSYSSDWDRLFNRDAAGNSVGTPLLETYNDNLSAALGEIERTLPENVKVNQIYIQPQGLFLELACEDKQTAAYTIIALRGMENLELYGSVSDLYTSMDNDRFNGFIQESNQAMAEQAQALAELYASMTESAPTEGSVLSSFTGQQIYATVKGMSAAELKNYFQQYGSLLNQLTETQKSEFAEAAFSDPQLTLLKTVAGDEELTEIVENSGLFQSAEQKAKFDSYISTIRIASSTGLNGVLNGLGAAERDALLVSYAVDGQCSYSLADLLNANSAVCSRYGSPGIGNHRAALKKLLLNPATRERFYTLLSQDAQSNSASGSLFDKYAAVLKNNSDVFMNASASDSASLTAARQTLGSQLEDVFRSRPSIDTAEQLIQSDSWLSGQLAYYLASEIGAPVNNSNAGEFNLDKLTTELSVRQPAARSPRQVPSATTLNASSSNSAAAQMMNRFASVSSDPYLRDKTLDYLSVWYRSSNQNVDQKNNQNGNQSSEQNGSQAGSQNNAQNGSQSNAPGGTGSDLLDLIRQAMENQAAATREQTEAIRDGNAAASGEGNGSGGGGAGSGGGGGGGGGESVEPGPDGLVYFAAALNYRDTLYQNELERKGLHYDDKVPMLEVEP